MADDALSNGDILKALGLKRPNTQANPLRDLWNKLIDSVTAGGTYSDYVNDVNSLGSWGEYETYLQDNHGFSSGEATALREQLEPKYSSFTDFQDALSTFDSFEEWENSLSWGETIGGEATDEDGRMVTGFRFHDSPGVTRDSVRVPAGTVEIFGKEIHFSSTKDPVQEESSESLFSYSNMSVEPNPANNFEPVTFSVDVTNTGSYEEPFTAKLKVDGEVDETSDLVKLASGETRTFTFERGFAEAGTHDIQISGSSTVELTVYPPGLIA